MVKKLAAEYSQSLYINLEDDPDMAEMFESTRDPGEIYLSLSVSRGFSPSGKSLLIIDEIQSCEAAFSALKPLKETADVT